MSLMHRIASLALVAALGAQPSDRPLGAPPATFGTGIAPARGTAIPLPGFELFGWVSPPADSTTDARYAEMAEAGLHLALPAWADSGRLEDNLRRLDFAAAHGIRCLVWDRRFERFLALNPASPEGSALLDSIVADYSRHPGFFGYYLGDEPPESQFPLLATLFRELSARDPTHPAWNNLFGPSAFATLSEWRDYIRHYLDQVEPSVVCDDQYDFLSTGDRQQFFSNVVGLSAMARARGIPFWSIVQLVEHGGYRALTDGELRWQASMLLAYGARGVGYFTYWTPAPDTLFHWQPAVIDWDGTRTHWFDTLQQFDPGVRAAGSTLASLTWLETLHANGAPAGTTPFAPFSGVTAVEGRAALGVFADRGGIVHVLVANSDSLASRTLTLVLRPGGSVSRLDEATGGWFTLVPSPDAGGARLSLDLAAGAFALVRLDSWRGVGNGLGPLLDVLPNPAHGEARFALTRIGAGARLSILDVAGRRVWSHAPRDGQDTVVWQGQRDEGGTAAPGLYLVRVENAFGPTTRRLQWLGAR